MKKFLIFLVIFIIVMFFLFYHKYESLKKENYFKLEKERSYRYGEN